MDRAMRLHVVAKIMYDVGWVALVGGTLVHLNIANRVFSVVDLSKRSLGRRTLLVHRALFSQTSGISTALVGLQGHFNQGWAFTF
jgi:hypothetical protein